MNANEIKILKSLQHGLISLPLIIFYLCTMVLNGLVVLFKWFNFWLPPFFSAVIQPIDFSSLDGYLHRCIDIFSMANGKRMENNIHIEKKYKRKEKKYFSISCYQFLLAATFWI